MRREQILRAAVRCFGDRGTEDETLDRLAQRPCRGPVVTTREYLTRDEAGTVNGGVSFWYRQIGIPARGPALPGDRSADVCIVGGGLTGLWTAYHLAGAQPDLRIVVLEKEFAGYGASGRNGGWLSAELAGNLDRYAATGGRDGVRRLVRAMEQTVDDVIGVCRDEGIDADIVKDGVLHVARTEPQLARLEAMLAEHAAWGFGEGHERRLTRAEVHDRVRVEGALAAVHSPHAARVQPAKLVRGLLDAVRRRGVTVYEGTEVTGHPARPGGHPARHRARRRRPALPGGLHRRAAGQPPRLAADEQLDGGHRAAAAAPSGARSGGRAPSWSATAPTPTATPSGPPTGASPSAAAGSPTGSARAPIPTA